MFEDDLQIVQTPRIKHLWDVTNFIDIMIVLLIFLIGTTSFTKSGILINQPESTTATAVPPKVIALDINQDGDVFYDSKSIDETGIKSKLTASLSSDPQVIVDIRADKNTRIDALFTVMDWCRESGATRFSFGAKKK